MKKSTISKTLLTGLLLVMGSTLASCSNEPVEILRIRNSEDYIYKFEEEGDLPDLVDQFEEYMYKEYGRNVEVVYSTFDTNEKLYNDLKLGKSNYDLIVPSDYMIQKLLALDLLEPFDFDSEDLYMENVDNYLSPYIKDVISSIESVNGYNLADYSIPYMWGTIGIMYNPEFYISRGFTEEEIDEAFTSYDVLYDERFKGTISIKDSVRDLYAVGVVHIEKHKEEIIALQTQLKNEQITNEAYHEKIVEIFNRNDDEVLELVQEDLIAMKENSFGFEVDGGKNDMVNGTIGANLCWSGDAVYSIEEAASDEDNPTEIRFSVPTSDTISNIWFDCFVMPKSDSLNKELAQKFVDFIYDPEIAALNMDYIGYTCAAGGDDILNMMYDYYDVRGVDEDYVRITEVDPELVEGDDYVKYDLTYFFEGTIDNIEDAVLLVEPDAPLGQLRAKFVEKEDLDYLAIMKDFGDRNEAVMHMWEKVRTSPVPNFVAVMLIVELVIAITVIAFFIIIKSRNKKEIRKILDSKESK